MTDELAGDTADTLRSTTGSGSSRGDGEPVITATQPVHPYVHVVVVAVIGAVAVLAWLVVFETVNKLLWENDFVTANPWMFPVICLPFSLARRAARQVPPRPHEPGRVDARQPRAATSRRSTGGALPVDDRHAAWASLFSGAVLGPEGGIGGIASKIAAMYNEKVGIPVEHRQQLVFSTLASAYNGLIANPLFTGVLGTELVQDPEATGRGRCPPTSSAARSATSSSSRSGCSGLENYLHLSPTQPYQPLDVAPRRAVRRCSASCSRSSRARCSGSRRGLRAVRGPGRRAGARRRRHLQRRRHGRADRAVLGRDADPDGRRGPGGLRAGRCSSGWPW